MALAEQRRRAFRQFLFNQNMSAAELARRAGLPTANTLYNFLKGRTASLAQTTLEVILAAMPGVTITDLMGTPRYSTGADTALGSLRVTADGQSGAAQSALSHRDDMIDRDTLALEITFELQPLSEAIANLGLAVTGAESETHRFGSSDPSDEIRAAWIRRNEVIREQLRLVEQRAAALIAAAERLAMAR